MADPCRLVRQVKKVCGETVALFSFRGPCRLVRQVNKVLG